MLMPFSFFVFSLLLNGLCADHETLFLLCMTAFVCVFIALLAHYSSEIVYGTFISFSAVLLVIVMALLLFPFSCHSSLL